MNSRFAALAVVVVVLAGCQTAVTAPDSMTLLDEARQAAAAMQQSLASKLFAEINTNGAESAIGVCKTLAPGAAAELSAQRGMRVSRVSLKPRNPVLGAADAWEQRVLIDFDRRAAQGENSGALEHSEVVAEPAARYFRYMKAL
ncbi:DUF3365 domain-containing protein, partial [candidate division KSB1 bacterium]|nr:DUF3365 domain-containing protein [candidate division KSB1 bacterium]